MKFVVLSIVTVLVLAGAALIVRDARSITDSATLNAAAPDAQTDRSARAGKAMDRDDAERVLQGWTPGPRLAGNEMMAKYGPPHEGTPERMIWRNAGPYKRIMLTREELPHDFPITHMDYLEHTISYNVPSDKTDEVHAFDASITIYRVAGELSARWDLESNNVLTLNLANDIVMGKKTVAAARQEFGKVVMDRTLGNPPPSTTGLLFSPMSPEAAADQEQTTLPNTSQRADRQKMALSGKTTDPKVTGDGEILALMIALDENEVHAAMAAEQKKLGEATMAYARKLHQEHGKHIQDTEQLGAKINVTPLETGAVDDLHNKGAEQLAKLVQMTGDDFDDAFMTAMIAGHRDALQMIDGWMSKASDASLKQHLSATRQRVDGHLKEAEQHKGRK